MGDIYHAGESYAGSVPIDDTDTSPDKVWSSQKINNTKADQAAIAPVENGTTASRAYAIDENFMKDGAFCTAIAAIAQGATFTLDTNYTAGTVGERVETMMEEVQEELGGKTPYIIIDASTLVYSDGNSHKSVYLNSIPSPFYGIAKVLFSSGNNATYIVSKTNNSWGSIIAIMDSNSGPYIGVMKGSNTWTFKTINAS